MAGNAVLSGHSTAVVWKRLSPRRAQNKNARKHVHIPDVASSSAHAGLVYPST